MCPKCKRGHIVVTKKYELITTGLSSEAYLLAFLEPASGYAIARKLEKSEKPNGNSKTPTNYSKVVESLKALAIDNYLNYNYKEKKYYPNIMNIM